MRTIRSLTAITAGAILALASQAGVLAQSSAPVTLTFWDLEEGAATEARAELIEEFEAANPGITVDHVVKGFDDLNATIRFALQGANAPDVAAINQGFNPMGPVVAAGLLEPLDAYAETYGWRERFPSGVLLLNSFEPDGSAFGSGNLYGLSTTAEIVGIFYNKAKLAELGLDLPTTTDEFVAAVDAGTQVAVRARCARGLVHVATGATAASVVRARVFVVTAGERAERWPGDAVLVPECRAFSNPHVGGSDCADQTAMRKKANERKMLALSTPVTSRRPSSGRPLRRRLRRKANSATRSVPLRVITCVSAANSSYSCTPAPKEANSPSRFSRSTTKSMPGPTSRSGVGTPA